LVLKYKTVHFFLGVLLKFKVLRNGTNIAL